MDVQVADYEDAILNGADKENSPELDLDSIRELEEMADREDYLDEAECRMYQDAERNI